MKYSFSCFYVFPRLSPEGQWRDSSPHAAVSSRSNVHTVQKEHGICPAWCVSVCVSPCYIFPYATASTSTTVEASTSAWSSTVTMATQSRRSSHPHILIQKKRRSPHARGCVFTHTPQTAVFAAWGRRLYCYPWTDENFSATRPLLLKHRLTLYLWCLTAVSPHLHLNYIHSSHIYWQQKCWATTAYTPLHPFPSVAIAQTTHSFELNSIQINSESSQRSWSHSFSPSLQCNSDVIDWWERPMRVTYPLVLILLP